MVKMFDDAGWQKVEASCKCLKKSPDNKNHFCLDCGQATRDHYMKDFPEFIADIASERPDINLPQLVWVLRAELEVLRAENATLRNKLD